MIVLINTRHSLYMLFRSMIREVWGGERKALLRDVEAGLCAAYNKILLLQLRCSQGLYPPRFQLRCNE